jgi:hypothetical protein
MLHCSFFHSEFQRRITRSVIRSVEEGAVPADVPLRGVGLDADAAEPGHGVDEGLLEVGGVLRPRHDGGLRAGVGVEHLVGGEEPPAIDQVDEVLVVEGLRGDGVQLQRDVGVHPRRARRLQVRRVRGVHRRVHRRRLDPFRERAAVREPHRVRRCNAPEGDGTLLYWEISVPLPLPCLEHTNSCTKYYKKSSLYFSEIFSLFVFDDAEKFCEWDDLVVHVGPDAQPIQKCVLHDAAAAT